MGSERLLGPPLLLCLMSFRGFVISCVSKIALGSDRGINGTIPVAIGALTNLQYVAAVWCCNVVAHEARLVEK